MKKVMQMRCKEFKLLLFFFIFCFPLCHAEQALFKASYEQPYHLSVGAVLFDKEGRIACHHFDDILDFKDIYILMRESMEPNETIMDTLHRGLKEEFGATATPVSFIGALSGNLDMHFSFEKTTVYVVCFVTNWDPKARDANDPEAGSHIEWLDPYMLIEKMKEQGRKFQRVDVDESEMIFRAIPYIHCFLSTNN